MRLTLFPFVGEKKHKQQITRESKRNHVNQIHIWLETFPQSEKLDWERYPNATKKNPEGERERDDFIIVVSFSSGATC